MTEVDYLDRIVDQQGGVCPLIYFLPAMPFIFIDSMRHWAALKKVGMPMQLYDLEFIS